MIVSLHNRNACSKKFRETLLRKRQPQLQKGVLPFMLGRRGRDLWCQSASSPIDPLFKMLLDKSYDEVGFKQEKRLVVPCSVSTFQEVVNALKCSNGKFDFGNLVEEFI
ncbi:hypothetical protein SLA2020_147790 [Shorea laevis]